MVKTLLLSILMLFTFTFSYGQKEFWGLNTTGGSVAVDIYGYGAIFKTDFSGANPQYVHLFDFAKGMKPYGRLFQASNGKIYGTASQGGIEAGLSSLGVLFEYDLETDDFNVVTYFGNSEIPNITRPLSGLIEPVPGTLTGNADGVIYRHAIAGENTTLGAIVPSISYQSITHRTYITGELFKASDGFLYGTTYCPLICPGAPNSFRFNGAIARYNISNNAFNIMHPFDCSIIPNGVQPTGSLVEGLPGKLYGTTQLGGSGQGGNGQSFGAGTLFEYTIATNTFTKKIDFDYNTTGAGPGPLVLGANGKLYGVLTTGSTNPNNAEQHLGTLYEYDIATNTANIVHHFGTDALGNYTDSPQMSSVLKASDGNLYGFGSTSGIFKFDPTTQAVTTTTSGSNLDYFYVGGFSNSLIEICRKPSYHVFNPSAFVICEQETFVFDVQNTNAQTYVWKKGTSLLPSQTTGILTLTNLSVADSGAYTCEMTNECGTTVTMPLQLTVEDCLGLDSVIGSKNAIAIYPNPAQEMLHLKLPDLQNFEIKKYTIRNMLGQTVYSDNKNYLHVNVSALPKGIYQVELLTDKGEWLSKFIKS